MGKFRGHQDKSRRGRERKKLLNKNAGAAARKVRAAELETTAPDDHSLSSNTGPQQQQQGGKAVLRAGAGSKKKPKHVTYAKEHSVLIVGDGDFSFTRGVIKQRGTGAGVVATSLDSNNTVLKKYPRARMWLPKLFADGAQIVHSVDATRLEETLLTRGGGHVEEVGGGDGVARRKKLVLFDRVVFNFPHTGKQRIHLNRNLIRDFFASTKGLVKCAVAGGEVHVTLKDKPPYSGWNVKAMAKESELILVRCLTFDPSVFPGYRHSTTDPQAKDFDVGGAKTYVFCRARSALDENVDESGTFPVIVQPGAASYDGHPTTVDDTGSKTGDKANGDDDHDTSHEKNSVGELFGKAGVGGADRFVETCNGSSGEERNSKNEGECPADGAGEPPVRQKSRASKRRALRKRKAAATKGSAAAASGLPGGAPQGAASSPDGVTKAKSLKRRRGKYVRSANQRRRDEE